MTNNMQKSEQKPFPFLKQPINVTKQNWNDDLLPLVSVSCKTYMHAPFIRDAIEGFLMQQTTFPVEILIHDDASHDGTADIVREYEARHPQLIKATYQVENQYKKNPKTDKYVKPHPRRGKYVALCEGDDYWTDPLKLQKQVSFLEANPDYNLTCGGFLSVDVNTSSTKEVIKLQPSSNADGYTFTLEDMLKGWITKTLTAVYRKDALNVEELQRYKYRRDVHLFYHLIKNSKGYYFSDILGAYRIHSGGVFSSKSFNEQLLYHLRLYKELYDYNNDEFTRRIYLKTVLLNFAHNLKPFPKKKKLTVFSGLIKAAIKEVRLPRDLVFLLGGLKKQLFNSP